MSLSRNRAAAPPAVVPPDSAEHGLPTVIETRYGSLDVPRPEGDLIGRFLAETGEWALDEARFVASVLGDGARVLDGGAFLGTFGLGLAQFRKLDLLCCVEANPRILPLLEANLRRNATGPFVALGALLGARDGEARIGHGELGNLGSTSFAEDAIGDCIVPLQKPGITLQTLRARHGDFDLVKLDIEGMEREVLEADAAHLASGSTTLWIECNEGPSALAIAELLLSWGLDVWYFAFPSHNPDNFRGRREPLFRWAYEAGLLAAPRRTPVLDSTLVSHRCILRPIGSLEDLAEAMWRTPRWLPPELDDADELMLAGVAGHALRGLSREDFLSRNRIVGRGRKTEAGEAAAQELAESRLAELEAMKQLRERTQDGLEHAQRLVASQNTEIATLRKALQETQELAESRLAELEAVKRLRERTQNGLEQAQDIAISHLAELDHERRMRRAAEARLAQAGAVALDRLAEVGALTERIAEAERVRAAAEAMRLATEAGLAQAGALALDRLAEVGALTEQIAEAERVRVAAQDFEDRLRAIQLTPAWRAASRVHRFIDRHGRLHRVLRSIRAAIGTALGRRR